jgi:hypothetical protein
MEIPKILRTAKHGCFELYTGGWGTYIRPTDDPEANVIISKEDLESFTLKEDIHKIPADLWQRWVQLAFYFVEKVPSNVEVSVRILRSEEDPSLYRILVPKQKVSAASVRVDSFDDAIDIETGEVITSYPPIGWIPVGSSHSHQQMTCSFSSTDDKYELGDPGIHIIVGSIDKQKRTYGIFASVVANGRRFKIPHKDLIETEPLEGYTFHEDVLDYVDYSKPVVTKYSSNQRTNWNGYNYKSPFGFKDNIDGDFSELWDEFYGYQTHEKESIKLHQIEDVIEDFLKQNKENPEEIEELMALLSVYIEDHQFAEV